MRKLEKDVNKERGITFTPIKYSSSSARSMSQSKIVTELKEKPKITNMKNKDSNVKSKLPPKPKMK